MLTVASPPPAASAAGDATFTGVGDLALVDAGDLECLAEFVVGVAGLGEWDAPFEQASFWFAGTAAFSWRLALDGRASSLVVSCAGALLLVAGGAACSLSDSPLDELDDPESELESELESDASSGSLAMTLPAVVLVPPGLVTEAGLAASSPFFDTEAGPTTVRVLALLSTPRALGSAALFSVALSLAAAVTPSMSESDPDELLVSESSSLPLPLPSILIISTLASILLGSAVLFRPRRICALAFLSMASCSNVAISSSSGGDHLSHDSVGSPSQLQCTRGDQTDRCSRSNTIDKGLSLQQHTKIPTHTPSLYVHTNAN